MGVPVRVVISFIIFVILLSVQGTANANDQLVKSACEVDLSGAKSIAELNFADSRCRVAYNMDVTADKLLQDEWKSEHRTLVFRLQFFITGLMFLLIFSLILIGIIFCYKEFTRGVDSTTKIVIGTNNFEVNSKLIGILVLFISLGFAFIFFDKAYSISQVGAPATAQSK